MARIAVYPGSFDPITKGHLDILRRACRLFDKVIVAVATNSLKKHTFSIEERIGVIKKSITDIPGADVGTFDGLLVDFLKESKATVIIRGIRAVTDMDYEFQMASMNRQILPEIETVFLMPDERYTYLASSIVKEVGRMGARVEEFLPPAAVKMLRDKFPPPGR